MLAAVSPGHGDLVLVGALSRCGQAPFLCENVGLDAQVLLPVLRGHLGHLHELDELRSARGNVQNQAFAVVGS